MLMLIFVNNARKARDRHKMVREIPPMLSGPFQNIPILFSTLVHVVVPCLLIRRFGHPKVLLPDPIDNTIVKKWIVNIAASLQNVSMRMVT
jgi:hypothetical protein